MPGYVDSFDTYITDVLRLGGIISEERPGKKIFLLGESMGGLITFLTAIEHPHPFAGVILISPAFTSKLKFTPIDYLMMAASLLYDPKKNFIVPFKSEMCTRDVEYQKMLDSDPKEHRIATSKLFFNVSLAQARSRMEKSNLKLPSLFLVAGDDSLVYTSSTKKIFSALKTEDKKLIEYPGMRHALSIELGKEKVFDDILRWTMERYK